MKIKQKILLSILVVLFSGYSRVFADIVVGPSGVELIDDGNLTGATYLILMNILLIILLIFIKGSRPGREKSSDESL